MYQALELAEPRLVALQLGHLLGDLGEHVGDGRAQLVELPDGRLAVGHVPERQRRGARLSSVSTMVHSKQAKRRAKEGTHLDPAHLVLHKVEQEPLRHLAAALLHALEQLRLGRLQRAAALVLQRAAQHLEPQADAPEAPDEVRVKGELAAGLHRRRLLDLDAAVVAALGPDDVDDETRRHVLPELARREEDDVVRLADRHVADVGGGLHRGHEADVAERARDLEQVVELAVARHPAARLSNALAFRRLGGVVLARQDLVRAVRLDEHGLRIADVGDEQFGALQVHDRRDAARVEILLAQHHGLRGHLRPRSGGDGPVLVVLGRDGDEVLVEREERPAERVGGRLLLARLELLELVRKDVAKVLVKALELAEPRLVALQLGHLLGDLGEHVGDGRAQLVELPDGRLAVGHVPERQRRGARKEPLRHLAAALLHALEQLRLGRLQRAAALVLQRAAQHLEPQADAPEAPDEVRVKGELAAGLHRRRLLDLDAAVVLLVLLGAADERVRVQRVDDLGVLEALELALAHLLDFEALRAQGPQVAPDRRRQALVVVKGEPLRHLAAALLHALEQLRLGRLQRAAALVLQGAAQHLEPQADAPETPDEVRVQGELAAGLHGRRLLDLDAAVVLLVLLGAADERVRVQRVDDLGVLEALELALAHLLDFEALRAQGPQVAPDRRRQALVVVKGVVRPRRPVTVRVLRRLQAPLHLRDEVGRHGDLAAVGHGRDARRLVDHGAEVVHAPSHRIHLVDRLAKVNAHAHRQALEDERVVLVEERLAGHRVEHVGRPVDLEQRDLHGETPEQS
ncbi:hypothetical protein BN1708_012730 [Verticillium longisporum]|uniref:Uncharacterized protein n=1 Tax=Verticillium longisporum TaxID=100787 RepID=A0A0G4LDF7_VERLO|nr:hypothetical protein BN1708_012730 [Verticillium longisporum]